MNVALRAIHEVLSSARDPAARWSTFVEALMNRFGPDRVVKINDVSGLLRDMGISTSAIGWIANLHTLGVIDADGRLNEMRATDVTTALRMVGDSFAVEASSPTWSLVATLPPEVWRQLRPAPFRQTAGVMLGLIDHAVRDLTLAAPYVDASTVGFLRESVATAMRRGVKVEVLTSPGRSAVMRPLVEDACQNPACRLTVTELGTVMSSLGSHAKVVLVDGREAYVGSANLTSAGLGRHVEIGVELAGPQVEELVRFVAALEGLGRRVFRVVDGRLTA